MPGVASRPHIRAVASLLTGGGLTVLPGGEGAPVAPCVVLWGAPGDPDGTLADSATTLSVPVALVACGTTADQAMWVADRITSLLTHATPTVAGRVCMPMWCESSTAVARDDDSTPPVWFAAMSWRLTSVPT